MAAIFRLAPPSPRKLRFCPRRSSRKSRCPLEWSSGLFFLIGTAAFIGVAIHTQWLGRTLPVRNPIPLGPSQLSQSCRHPVKVPGNQDVNPGGRRDDHRSLSGVGKAVQSGMTLSTFVIQLHPHGTITADPSSVSFLTARSALFASCKGNTTAIG
jgi:hypothetical protein